MGKKEEWDGARTLYDLLDIDDKLKPYVTNYKLNIFDYHDYKDFSVFKTENRFLFELLSGREDKKQMEKIMKEYLNDYSLDEEAVKAIMGMLDIKTDINRYKEKTVEGERYNMCKAWDEQKESGRREGRREGRQEGRREGRREGLIALICTLKECSIDLENIYQNVIKQEIYRNVTFEQVSKYYNG